MAKGQTPAPSEKRNRARSSPPRLLTGMKPPLFSRHNIDRAETCVKVEMGLRLSELGVFPDQKVRRLAAHPDGVTITIHRLE